MRIVKFTLKFMLGLMAGLVLVGGCVGALAIWYFGRDLPDYQQLTDYQPPIVTRVYAGDGRLLAEYADREARLRAGQGDAAARHPRLPRRRGQEFLHPSRHRPGGDAARGA